MRHVLGAAVACVAVGCAQDPVAGDGAGRSGPPVVVKDNFKPPPARDPAAPVLIDGEPVEWSLITPLLAEAAGRLVLEEIVLDRALEAECARRGITVTPEDIERERRLVLENIARDAGADAEQAQRLVSEIRVQRGLGEQRFRELLRRNARLRKFVDATVTDEDVAQLFQARHGERVLVRLILVPSRREAARVLEDLGPEPTIERFAMLARERSIDASAARGGLLEPASPADPRYPASARAVLRTLEAGQVSEPISVDDGFAVLMAEARVPADGTVLADVSEGLRAEVRRARERVLMSDLARQMVDRAAVTVLDPALRWSWQAGK